MVKVTVWNSPQLHSIHVMDHATGSEQVCAGVSSLVYGLAGWLKNRESGATVILEDGDALLESTSGREDVETAFSVAIIGLLQIEKGYPEFIRVET